ncbi:hypothetical protein Afe04nite_11680 [Asanoa ferruginea]|nr:hypothetical protein Afe04nite_11680 [Asanoa ferruginea]
MSADRLRRNPCSTSAPSRATQLATTVYAAAKAHQGVAATAARRPQARTATAPVSQASTAPEPWASVVATSRPDTGAPNRAPHTWTSIIGNMNE